jgi:hypothetical protein
MITSAQVRALAGQRGAIGESMVHQDTEIMAIAPAHRGQAARMVEGGFRGGFQQARH